MKNHRFSPLMFITNYQSRYTHVEQVERALKAGVKWIQYRPKDVDDTQVITQGQQIVALCHQHQCSVILNDSVHLVREINADGVHLGQKDMSADKARQILGQDIIIGGTANTLEDIRAMVNKGVDYIGLGPYRYTSTKQNLSPVLGLKSYNVLLVALRQEGIRVPVYAIGGICAHHIPALVQTGVYGVAVSSILSELEDMFSVVKHMNALLCITEPGA